MIIIVIIIIFLAITVHVLEAGRHKTPCKLGRMRDKEKEKFWYLYCTLTSPSFKPFPTSSGCCAPLPLPLPTPWVWDAWIDRSFVHICTLHRYFSHSLQTSLDHCLRPTRFDV